VERVLQKTLEEMPGDATHWSVRSMSKVSGISPATIRRIWHAISLQPHRSKTFRLSKDPLFLCGNLNVAPKDRDVAHPEA